MQLSDEDIGNINDTLKYIALIAGTTSGIIGLLFDFKNKRTKKITTGGTAILAVIIFSGIISIISARIDKYLSDKEKARQNKLTQEQLKKNDRILLGVNDAVNGISRSLATDRTILDGVNSASKDVKKTLHKNDRILGGVHVATNGITKSLKDNDTLLRGMNYAIRNIDRAQYPFTKLRFQATFTLSLDIPKFKSVTDNIASYASAHAAAVQHVDLFTPGPVNYVDLSYSNLVAFAGNDSLLYRIVRGIAYPEIIFHRQHVAIEDVQFNLPFHLEDKEKYAGRFDVYPLVYDLDSKTLFFRFNAKIDDDDPRTMRSGQLLSVLDLRYGTMGVVFQIPESVKLPPEEIRLFRLLKIDKFVLFINNQEWFLEKFAKSGLSTNNVQFHFTFPTDLSQLVLESYHPKP